MSEDIDRLDKFQNAATRKKEQKKEKHRRRRETIGYLISLIWEIFQYVLILLLFVSAIIAGVILGGIAEIVIFIVLSWIVLTLIKEAIMGKREIKIKDFFKFETIAFNIVAYVLLAIIRLYCLIIYHH